MWYLDTVAGLGHTAITVRVRYCTRHFDYSRPTKVNVQSTSSVLYVGLRALFHCKNGGASPEDGDRMFVWKDCKFLPDCTASYYIKFNSFKTARTSQIVQVLLSADVLSVQILLKTIYVSLVAVTLCRWPCRVQVGSETSDLHTTGCIDTIGLSWWWARCARNMHRIENTKKYIEKNCALLWSFTKNPTFRVHYSCFRFLVIVHSSHCSFNYSS